MQLECNPFYITSKMPFSPVLHAESQYGKIGSWHRDVNPQTRQMEEKRWVRIFKQSLAGSLL